MIVAYLLNPKRELGISLFRSSEEKVNEWVSLGAANVEADLITPDIRPLKSAY
ncbi:hypothetical protein HO173_004832 [Letharia columbiana]|uniref:Uncharacterized protein n=1 Tax=Letharia columbiana TaxID=112416 RepID=A0A8H6FYA0_9LECA|nr:uncharacterized protein HO173_004832 [Letharia columbiana]KAF6236953.1 hypothetical protein HO173_004832 [Letharia columbiana]